MGFQIHAASVRGPGHIVDGSPNQDAFLVRNWKSSWLAVVSDGMGSRKRSEIGSRLACKAVLETTRKCSFDVSDREFITLIYKTWLRMLGSVAPTDAVATCLIAWGQVDGKTRLFQLGDGVIIYSGIETGVISQQKDECFGNETTGLGISRKLSDWRTNVITLPKTTGHIALLTDGISDDIEEYQEFLKSTARCLENKGIRSGKRWISRQLIDWPTPNHTDDKTIVVIQRN